MSLVLPGVEVRQRALTEGPVQAHVLPAAAPMVDEDEDSGPKVTVKHGFIHIADEDSAVPDAHRGAKTCQARYADSNVSFTPVHNQDCSGDVEATIEEHYAHGYPETPMGSHQLMATSSAGSRGASLSLCLSEDGELRYFKAAEEASGSSPLQQGGYSSAEGEVFPPPPAYAAPAGFHEDHTTPPPVAPPGTSQVFFADAPQVHFGSHSPVHGNDANDLEARVTVKNTFIDIEGDRPNYDDRNTRTCMARLSQPSDFPSPLAVGTAAGDVAVPSQQQASPSVGSQSHGTLGPDGQPVCQPCAWFYKETGCHNQASCRYCHLCPQGELKNRKKQKIARLRNQEGDAAAAIGNTGG